MSLRVMMIFILLSITICLAGVFIGGLNIILNQEILEKLASLALWYSGIPFWIGVAFFGCYWASLAVKSHKEAPRTSDDQLIANLDVYLTCWNDEAAIREAVKEFSRHDLVERVIVIDNNSSDDSRTIAEAEGALVINELNAGYGKVVSRAIREIAEGPAEFAVICEGDMTFYADDIDRFSSYIKHADVVSGTRINKTLQEGETQINTFIHFGNYAVAKLLEIAHANKVSLSDVGCTYKIFRREAAAILNSELDDKINLHFNAYLIDVILQSGLRFFEIPIRFRGRIGRSKGGNKNNLAALKTGIAMILGVLTNWNIR